MKSCGKDIVLLGLLFSVNQIFCSNVVSTMKGIGSSFESFGKSIEDMGKGIGIGFGAPPSGYVYSYTVVNDTLLPIYVNTQEISSFMGAYFPKASGWSQAKVLPMTQNYTVSNKEYYFEMSIHAHDNKPTNHLPYVNTNALYVQDCIQLPTTKNSTKMHYFHVYMGKKIENGTYVHLPMAEYMGYADPSHAKDANATVTTGSALTASPALTVYNSTVKDLVVGYSSKVGATSLSKADCDLFLTTIEHHSFALRAPKLDAIKNEMVLPLGTVGIFSMGDTTSEVFAMPATVFTGKPYTLEIYQDDGEDRTMGLQALMSAHDVPSDRVRDITTVSSVFWYQSVAQLGKVMRKDKVDLPGQVWVVYQSDDAPISFQVPLGSAIQFDIARPRLSQYGWLYCVYVDVANGDQKGNQFIQNFIDKNIGQDVILRYKEQGEQMFNQIQKELSDIVTFSAAEKGQQKDTKKMVVPESLLIAAIEGSLKVNRGQIEDTASGVTGYLLGADVFLPQGVGSSATLYYQLHPSQRTARVKGAKNVPTSTVINSSTMGISSPPKGMPAPTVYT